MQSRRWTSRRHHPRVRRRRPDHGRAAAAAPTTEHLNSTAPVLLAGLTSVREPVCSRAPLQFPIRIKP
ncbi:hypothetical protein F2981_29315 (plasmid) [Sinorhizobium meliloti]|nr:hypothetical protein [Sinorhizobium meliloti]